MYYMYTAGKKKHMCVLIQLFSYEQHQRSATFVQKQFHTTEYKPTTRHICKLYTHQSAKNKISKKILMFIINKKNNK